MLQWKDSYSVNVQVIDDQHKQLFAIAGKLMDLIKSSSEEEDRYEEIREVLNELKNYTEYHFDYEEQLLRRNGYDIVDDHKVQHEEFIGKLSDLQKQDIYIKQKNAMMNILTFLIDWISEHIVKEDIMYGKFLNEKGIF
jgi:hemerythrin